MTLNNCASMKLEVHFQCKQVSQGKSGVCDPVAAWGTQDIHKPLMKLALVSWSLGVWGSALLQPGSRV